MKKLESAGTSSDSVVISGESAPSVRESLKVCYVNALSLKNKLHDLEEIVYKEEHDVVGVAESWINTSNRDVFAEFALPGYTLFSCERQCRDEGGVLFYFV